MNSDLFHHRVLSILRDMGIITHPVEEDAWLLNLDTAIESFGLDNNEMCKETVRESIQTIANGWGMKIFIVKTDQSDSGVDY